MGLLSKVQRSELDSGFKVAKAKLDTHPGQGPFVIASKTSQAAFDAWDDDGKAAWGIGYDSLAQNVLLYGDTGFTHACLSGYFTQAIAGELCSLSWEIAGITFENSTLEQRRQAGRALGRPRGYGRTTMYTDRGARSPDSSFYGGKISCGRSLVIEVAHGNESFQALQKEIKWWHAAGVSMVLGVWVDVNSEVTDPNLILLSQTQESHTMRQKPFGHASGCTQLGLPDFQLEIPVNLLLNHDSPEVLNKCINLDLYEMQQDIIEFLKQSADF